MGVTVVILSLFMSSVRFIYWGVRRWEDLIWYKWTQLSKRNRIVYKVICDPWWHDSKVMWWWLRIKVRWRVLKSSTPAQNRHPWILYNKYTWIFGTFHHVNTKLSQWYWATTQLSLLSKKIALVSMLGGVLQWTWFIFLHGNIFFSFHTVIACLPYTLTSWLRSCYLIWSLFLMGHLYLSGMARVVVKDGHQSDMCSCKIGPL